MVEMLVYAVEGFCRFWVRRARALSVKKTWILDKYYIPSKLVEPEKSVSGASKTARAFIPYSSSVPVVHICVLHCTTLH